MSAFRRWTPAALLGLYLIHSVREELSVNSEYLVGRAVDSGFRNETFYEGATFREKLQRLEEASTSRSDDTNISKRNMDHAASFNRSNPSHYDDTHMSLREVDAETSASLPNRTVPSPSNATSINVTTQYIPTMPEVPIVVIAKGELGNIVMRLLHGLSVTLESEGVPTRLFARMGGPGQSGKFTSSLPILKNCFADIASRVDFGPKDDELGWAELEKFADRQRAWLGTELAEKLVLEDVHESGQIRERMNHLKLILRGMTEASGDAKKMCNQTVGTKVVTYKCLPRRYYGSIPLPFVMTEGFATFPKIDQHYEEMQKFVEYNDTGIMPDGNRCCERALDPDESAFHFRNFIAELRPVIERMPRFYELGPETIARDFFEPGDRVAITTRFPGGVTRKYADAMQSRNITVRIVSGQKPYQDFCMLKNAKRKLVGPAMSTFSNLACIFAKDLKECHKYAMNTTDSPRFYDVDWTRPALKERLRFPVYNSPPS